MKMTPCRLLHMGPCHPSQPPPFLARYLISCTRWAPRIHDIPLFVTACATVKTDLDSGNNAREVWSAEPIYSSMTLSKTPLRRARCTLQPPLRRARCTLQPPLRRARCTLQPPLRRARGVKRLRSGPDMVRSNRRTVVCSHLSQQTGLRDGLNHNIRHPPSTAGRRNRCYPTKQSRRR